MTTENAAKGLFCDEVDCESTDRRGEISIGHMTFHVCRRHHDMITGEDQVGLVKRAHIEVVAGNLIRITVPK